MSQCCCWAPALLLILPDGRRTHCTHLQRALDANPRLTQAALLLGEIAYSEGDVAMAIATLEKTLSTFQTIQT